MHRNKRTSAIFSCFFTVAIAFTADFVIDVTNGLERILWIFYSNSKSLEMLKFDRGFSRID